ncbi:mannitol dehydrogenase family protein [Aquipuribacter hungaricus]|uniref:Mannitol-1-phosphate 5-dehydrogenase n=1 Tax=Aquipuribacter hungaricus TaxID=545624 RepID=A0ABV7WJF9_9MICO
MSPALSQATVASLDPAVPVPGYDRGALRVGIVHLGVGGFHRAHQAAYLDDLMARGLGTDWALCGVGVLPHDRRIIETLQRQDGLYTLVVKHPDGRREPRVVGSVVRALLAPDDPQAVLGQMADPAVRIVSLTITEGGYLVNQVTGEFDAGSPAIAADLVPGAVPSTAFGYVVAALARRRAEGTPPFTVLSCDNIPGNGDVARRMMAAFARLLDPELADWMLAEVSFPSSMVDRITPVTVPDDVQQLTDSTGIEDGWPVVCEPFAQWVVEDEFSSGRPPLEEVGVQLVHDVEPYELMKLRLLNVGHQAIAYLGHLAGYRYAHEAASDPLFRRFLLGYMEREGSPTLPEVPGVDLDAYRHGLVDRFANPEVRDTLARLAAESSDRIPTWLVPVVAENLRTGGEVGHSALVIASWARYAEGVDEQGHPIEVVDRLKEQVMAAAARHDEDPLALLRDRDLFGDLVDDPRFTEAYAGALASLRAHGARATLEALVGPA